MNLAELLARRSALLKELEDLAKGDQTDQTRSSFDAKEKEIQALDADIARARSLETLRRSAAAGAAPPPPGDDGGGQQQAGDPIEQRAQQTPLPPVLAERRDMGFEFGGFVRCFAQSQLALREGRMTPPSQIGQELYGERHHITQNLQRAQTMSDNAAGGFSVVPTYATEIIKLFGPNTIVRRRGNVVPGNADYLKGKTGAAVSYVGENEQGDVTGVTFGMMSLRERDVSAILPISKKLLRNTAFGVEAYCRDELVRAGAEFEDLMFLYGDGTGKKVKGYAHAIPAANKIAATSTATPSNQQVRADLRKLRKKLSDANVRLAGMNPAWFMHDSVLLFLQDLYQGDLKAFPSLDSDAPTLYGYPVDTTTQIAGPDGDGGDIFFGAHAHAMIGDTVGMSLSVSDQAGFKDANGNQVNMWAQGLLGIKLDMSHDFGLRYEQAFAQLTGVKWGA